MTPAAKTILVCEDEAHLRELVRAAIGSDYRFEEVTDGREALERARELRPDLVVLDLMLPGKSGIDVLAELRAECATRNTPVVVISAWSDVEAAALAAGATRFVGKPFEPIELKAIVDRLLANR